MATPGHMPKAAKSHTVDQLFEMTERLEKQYNDLWQTAR